MLIVYCPDCAQDSSFISSSDPLKTCFILLGDIIKNKISPLFRRPLDKSRRQRKSLYYRTDIKPECDTYHNQLKDYKDRNITFLYSKQIATYVLKQKLVFKYEDLTAPFVTHSSS